MEYYSAIKKYKSLPFVATWMDLEGIMLSEISQTEKKTPHDFTYMWNLENKTNEHTKQNRNRLIDTENKLVVARGDGGWWGMNKTDEENYRYKLPDIK